MWVRITRLFLMLDFYRTRRAIVGHFSSKPRQNLASRCELRQQNIFEFDFSSSSRFIFYQRHSVVYWNVSCCYLSGRHTPTGRATTELASLRMFRLLSGLSVEQSQPCVHVTASHFLDLFKLLILPSDSGPEEEHSRDLWLNDFLSPTHPPHTTSANNPAGWKRNWLTKPTHSTFRSRNEFGKT